MLEPTHRCNLSCAGCDRVRLHAKNHLPDLTLDECLAAVTESGAPVVTVTGGEPLLYGDLKGLLAGLVGMKKYIYLCTNGLLTTSFLDAHKPHPRLTLSFHVDGLGQTHDRLTGKPGSFETVIDGLTRAKKKGFRVWTNTSVYKWTDTEE
jgi:MoaA/NifB/PqqE/SkfB family radical SAM enzyme